MCKPPRHASQPPKDFPFGVIIGDSHAAAAFPLLSRVAKNDGKWLGVLTFPGCAPFLDVMRLTDKSPSACRAFRTVSEALLKKVKLDFAILDAQWAFHDGALVPAANDRALTGQREIFVEGVRHDLQTLRAAGARRIGIVGPILVAPMDVPDCVIRADRLGVEREKCAVRRADYLSRIKTIVEDLRNAAAGLDNVVVIDPVSVFCDEEWCRPYDGDSLLYMDFDHLSSAGVARLYKQRQQAFDWVIGSDQRAGSSDSSN